MRKPERIKTITGWVSIAEKTEENRDNAPERNELSPAQVAG